MPKLRLPGLIPRVKTGAMPVPLRPTEVGEVGALLTRERLPEAPPTDVGVNATVIVVCCPAPTFKGNENPLTAKAEPDSFTCVMFNVAAPVLAMIKAWDKLLPTTAFPKLIVAGLT